MPLATSLLYFNNNKDTTKQNLNLIKEIYPNIKDTIAGQLNSINWLDLKSNNNIYTKVNILKLKISVHFKLVCLNLFKCF